MDDQTFLSDPIDVEVARRLAAFAEARLSPSLEATARMRAAVMQAAQRQMASPDAVRSEVTPESTTTPRSVVRPRTAWRAWRRPMVAILAGCLMVGVAAGTVWSARPGGALYGARLWVEMANLPAQPVARAEAEVARLQARIDEAEQASASSDGPAVEAALLAYSTIVVEAAQGAAGDPVARSTIEARVELHLVLLTRIVGAEPEGAARTAAVRALTESTKVVDELRGPGGRIDQPGGASARRPADSVIDESKSDAHAPPPAEDVPPTVSDTQDPGQNGAAASDAADADADADAGRVTKADRESKDLKGDTTPRPAATSAPSQAGSGSSHAGVSSKRDCADCPDSKP